MDDPLSDDAKRRARIAERRRGRREQRLAAFERDQQSALAVNPRMTGYMASIRGLQALMRPGSRGTTVVLVLSGVLAVLAIVWVVSVLLGG